MKTFKTILAILFAFMPPIVFVGGMAYGIWQCVSYLQTHTPIHDFVYQNPFESKADINFFPGYPIIRAYVVKLTPFLEKQTSFVGLIRAIISLAIFGIFIKIVWYFTKRTWNNIKIIFTNPKRLFILIGTHISLLWYSVRYSKPLMALKTHSFLFRYLRYPLDIPVSGKEYHLFCIPFDQRGIIESLNVFLDRHIASGAYSIGPFRFSDAVISFRISEAGHSGEMIKASLLKNKEELLRLFPGFSGDAPTFDMEVKIHKDCTFVQLSKKDLWISRPIDFDSIKIPRQHILLGFTPHVTSAGVEYVDYTIASESFEHIALVGATRRGKDVVTMNIIYSILAQNKSKPVFDFEFFDTKLTDGTYLEGLEAYGIKRHVPKGDDYLLALQALVSEMDRRNALFGVHSKLANYHKAYPDCGIREKFVFINEFMDVIAHFRSKGQLDTFLDLLNALISKGAGAGFHIVIMTHTLRKSLIEGFAKLLTNITTKISVQMTDKNEIEIVASGLSKLDKDKLKHLTKYNALHIADFKIIKETRAYLITQDELNGWVERNFTRTQKLEAKSEDEGEAEIKTNEIQERIQRYFEHALSTGKLNFREATGESFRLTRTQWDTLIQKLETKDLIIRNPDRSISFKITNISSL